MEEVRVGIRFRRRKTRLNYREVELLGDGGTAGGGFVVGERPDGGAVAGLGITGSGVGIG